LATQRNRPVENTDYENPEIRGVIDFMHLRAGTSIEPVNDREFNMRSPEGRLEYEKFMMEPVVLCIHKTADKNEPFVADVHLNGEPMPLPRDVPIRIPRCFVEVLAQSQVRQYTQVRDPNPDATEGMKTHRHGGAQFPFQILHEPSPKGRAWLQRVTHTSA
jgi:hypothetical protein